MGLKLSQNTVFLIKANPNRHKRSHFTLGPRRVCVFTKLTNIRHCQQKLGKRGDTGGCIWFWMGFCPGMGWV